LTGAALMLTCGPGPPGFSRMLAAGVATREKSLSSAGLDPPPQEIIASPKKKLEHRPSAFEEEPISTLLCRGTELIQVIALPAAIRQIEGTPIFSDDLSRICLW
jgi:hypothetical protein